jgi:hypothetical protein
MIHLRAMKKDLYNFNATAAKNVRVMGLELDLPATIMHAVPTT